MGFAACSDREHNEPSTLGYIDIIITTYILALTAHIIGQLIPNSSSTGTCQPAGQIPCTPLGLTDEDVATIIMTSNLITAHR